MSDFVIPSDLVRLVSEQRVIPFVGAGFSATQELPGWEDLLREVHKEVVSTSGSDDLSFDDIQRACDGNPLQVAEYLYLRAGSTIGPIRYAVQRHTHVDGDDKLIGSTPHVELINLGSQQVYTTNFDDLLERTFRALRPNQVDVVALPRDVAVSHGDSIQIVKYHGDLRYDPTLVLTESQYYTRLDFESPMDLKFRSDLLGRSVLFMGYSFRDINIRVIWFKLMQMMKDVPAADRAPSYIVRLQANPVLDLLYEAVGLKTIVLDPGEHATTVEARNRLLGEFLTELSIRCSAQADIPGGAVKMFTSAGLLKTVLDDVNGAGSAGRRRAQRFGISANRVTPSTRLIELLRHLQFRTIPQQHRHLANELIEGAAKKIELGGDQQLVGGLAKWIAQTDQPSSGLTHLVALGLIRGVGRTQLLEDYQIPWRLIWQGELNEDAVADLLEVIRTEVVGHEAHSYSDADLAYAIDIAHRIASRSIAGEVSEEAIAEATTLIQRTAALYESAAKLEPALGAPAPDNLVEEIEANAGDDDLDLVPDL